MKRFSFFAVILALAICLQAFTAFAAVPSALSVTSNTPVNIFRFEKNEIPEIYFTNQSSPTYLMVPASHEAHSEIVQALAQTKVVKLSKYDPNSGVDTGFFVISKAGKKMITLRPGNIIEIDGEAYGTTANQYNRLVGLGNDDYKGLTQIAQWCAFMTYQNITKVEYSASPGSRLVEIPADNVRIAAKELHALEVKSGKVIFPNSVDLENWSNRTKMVYTFESGVQFSVYANSSFLFIESKGMTYSCQYTGDFSAYVARAKELAAKPVKAVTPAASNEAATTKTK